MLTSMLEEPKNDPPPKENVKKKKTKQLSKKTTNKKRTKRGRNWDNDEDGSWNDNKKRSKSNRKNSGRQGNKRRLNFSPPRSDEYSNGSRSPYGDRRRRFNGHGNGSMFVNENDRYDGPHHGGRGYPGSAPIRVYAKEITPPPVLPPADFARFNSGAVFLCTPSTLSECLERGLFGLPDKMWEPIVSKIKPNTALFLQLLDRQRNGMMGPGDMLGVFVGIGPPKKNLCKNAWKKTGRGGFPAQIAVKEYYRFRPLPSGWQPKNWGKSRARFMNEKDVQFLLSRFLENERYGR